MNHISLSVSYLRGPKALFFGVAIVLAVVILIDVLRPPSLEQRLGVLRVDLAATRVAADSCGAALEREQEGLLAGHERLDSLRREIAGYESLDPRGVPANSYEAYLSAFEAYNSGIPGRVAAGDSLRAHWDTCRALIELHNQLADSAKGLAEAVSREP